MPIFEDKREDLSGGEAPSGFTGETDRENGEYHYKNGYTQKIYSDAHYVPVSESVDPPRYYTPAQKKEKEPAKSGGNRPLLIVALCALFMLLGCGAGLGLTSRITASRIEDLRAEVADLTARLEEEEAPVSRTVTYGAVVTGSAEEPAAAPENGVSPSEIYRKACEEVVGVTTDVTYTNFFGQTSSSAVSGTGFVISEDGYVLTNYHVIEYAHKYNYAVKVMMHDGTAHEATIVGVEQDNDLAVLKIDAAGLTGAVLGDSDAIAVGDAAYAVGNPLGELEFTMTSGTISALDRLITTDSSSPAINMFQIDAAVNSGNSGGPVYNAEGEVIGVVTAKYKESGVEGIGFAIPINDAGAIARDLIKNGYVTGKAYLGIYYDESNTSIYNRYYRNLWGSPKGVMVLGIDLNSAAAKAGFQEFDTITAIDGHTVENCSDLLNLLKRYSAGDTAEVTIYRAATSSTSGETMVLTVTFDEAVPHSVSNGMSLA